jgi:magnesium chelatase subunit D
MRRRVVFPFPAIVGMEKAKLALLAAAVNPAIGGVLLRGDKGTGKTTLVRSLADVLPEIEVVADCPFQCHPRDPQLMCDSCYARYQRGERLPTAVRRMRVVDLPLSITVDRLVGTLDIKRALTEGVRALQPGLLAEANRNILYIDEVNLLDDYIVDVLLDAAAYGWNVVEREGISVRHPARFILVASMNPEEGELRPQLLDRFGLVVDVEAPQDPEVRAEIVRRAEEFNRDPEGFYKKWEPEIQALREKIRRAMELLPEVEMPDDLLKVLAETVVKLGIRTSRAEIITARTAKALAALEGRTKVTMEDLQKAMELALPHRLKAKPFEKPRVPPPTSNKQEESRQSQQQSPPQQPREPPRGGSREPQSGGDRPGGGGAETREAADVDVPIAFKKEVAGEARGLSSRASVKRVVGHPLGVPYMYLPAEGREPRDIDIAGSLVTAALRGGGLPLKVEPGDLAVRVRRARAPRISLVILDASGSMNFMKRIEAAKGLVKKIAEESYVKRSYVGLITFRGSGVDVVVEPTRNYWLVLDILEKVPSGGATPMSAALAYALEYLKRLRQRLKGDYWVYVVTDGKANVSLGGNIKEELNAYSAELSKLAKLVVVDTKPGLFEPSLNYIEVLAKYATDVLQIP